MESTQYSALVSLCSHNLLTCIVSTIMLNGMFDDNYSPPDIVLIISMIFRTCRALRGRMSVIKDVVRRVYRSLSPHVTNFDLASEVCPPSEFLRFYYSHFVSSDDERSVNFGSSNLALPSACNDMLFEIQMIDRPNDNMPQPVIDAVVLEFANVLRQFQLDGDLYPICKLGCFSRKCNRDELLNCVWYTRKSFDRDPPLYVEVTDARRLRVLEKLLLFSFGVVNLDPEVMFYETEVNQENGKTLRYNLRGVFEHIPALTGLHMCINVNHLSPSFRVNLGGFVAEENPVLEREWELIDGQ